MKGAQKEGRSQSINQFKSLLRLSDCWLEFFVPTCGIILKDSRCCYKV